jgi:exopolyphosphatase / guanosine-5'-triphosphate,3'-diphosphate pyrophosphatase
VAPTGPTAMIAAMRVAVIDVGSNTARLLVADVDEGLEPVREERTYLGLAADILAGGSVSAGKRKEAASVVGRYARLAERLGADEVAAIVTAPGRQGRGSDALVEALSKAVDGPVRILSADDEGRFAFLGATARLDRDSGVVAVCDVGGGSTEIAVGTVLLGPAWVRSADIGSLRLTRLFLDGDPASASAVEDARLAVRRELEELSPPRADLALAVGGSARAVAKIVGRRLGGADLDDAVRIAGRRSAAKLARVFGFDAARAETVLAGALILSEVSRRLDAPLELGRGGLREGIALTLARRSAARAA